MERMSRLDERQYTLQELADFAGVSIRTIRYYIGEGLLPAPEGAGPQSHYTESHALRLQVIGLLKERYLPLREIRRALAGLDDVEVARLIDELDSSNLQKESRTYFPVPAGEISEPQVLYDAAEYIDAALAEHQPQQRSRVDRRRLNVTGPRVDGESWQRIEVADGVELLVRDDVYRRRQDQLGWLIDWARKVID